MNRPLDNRARRASPDGSMIVSCALRFKPLRKGEGQLTCLFIYNIIIQRISCYYML
jgi:hypothetical protein